MTHHYINFEFDFFRVMLNDKVILSRELTDANTFNTSKIMRLATEHATWLNGFIEAKWIDASWHLTFYRPETAGPPKEMPIPLYHDPYELTKTP